MSIIDILDGVGVVIAALIAIWATLAIWHLHRHPFARRTQIVFGWGIIVVLGFTVIYLAIISTIALWTTFQS